MKRIEALLSHFYVAARDATVEAMVSRDWLETLRDLPFEHVDAGCIAYLKNPRFSEAGNPIPPHPAEIRDLALDAQRDTDIKARNRIENHGTPTTRFDLEKSITSQRVTASGRPINEVWPEVAEEYRQLRLDRPEITIAEAYAELSRIPEKT